MIVETFFSIWYSFLKKTFYWEIIWQFFPTALLFFLFPNLYKKMLTQQRQTIIQELQKKFCCSITIITDLTFLFGIIENCKTLSAIVSYLRVPWMTSQNIGQFWPPPKHWHNLLTTPKSIRIECCCSLACF